MSTSTVRSRARRRAAGPALLLGAALAASIALLPVPAAAAPAPTPTPARIGPPTSIAALGDSITQATGTGQLAQETPKNSWATGSDISSVRARLGIPTSAAQNLAANGARMEHADTQATNGRDGEALRTSTQYVTIELGGNDLCRDSVTAMTPVATYRTQLREALAAVKARAPQALVFVMSVPDIYNLWYIRGAPQNATYHPEPESDQAGGLNGARFYWDGLTGLGVKFPCQSLLANPDSYAQADRDRRAAVRQRTMEYNAALRAECGLWLRCRYDDDRLFDLTSNRVDPPFGPLLPFSQWAFTDGDVSRNTGSGTWLCPVQGVFAGGCGDHFHPSLAGQVKLADSATASSYQWADRTAPTVGSSAVPGPRPDGTYRGPVTVSFSGSDAAGLRGQEVRVHHPDGTVTPWSESIGVHPPVTVTRLGVTHVEARSLDVNGNLSASRILTLDLTNSAPGAPSTPVATAGDDQVALSWSAPADDGGTAVTGYEVERTDPTGAPELVGSTPASPTATSVASANGRVATFRVRAANDVGAGAWSEPSAPVLPPFAQPGDFVDRVYADLAQRAPTPEERAAALARLLAGDATPAALTAELVADPAWEPMVSPVVRLYRAYFLRFPEDGGLAYWEARHRAGLTISAMSQLFSGTPEFRTMYGSLTTREFVRRVYLNVLEREPEPAGWDYWTAELDSGRFSRGRMMTFYSESIENRALTRDRVLPIVVWWGLLDRVPTPVERDAATSTLRNGGTVEQLVERIFATDEWALVVTR